MRKLATLTSLALAALLGLAAVGRAAAPLEDRIPQDAIIYFGWAGSDALQPQYAASNLKMFIDASSAPAFIAQQLPKLIDLAAKNDPQAPQIIAQLQTGLGVAWHHPSAFYFCPIDFTNPQQPGFRFGLLCDAGADANTLSTLLKETVAKIPPQPELPITVTVDGTLVGVTFGKPQVAAERQKGGTLAANPAYIKAMAHFKVAKPALAGYLDFAQGLALVNDALTKIPGVPAEVRTRAAIIIDALGLNGLGQMAMVSGFDGKEWSDQSFLGVTGQPKGILTLIGSQPLSDAALSVVPKDAASFSTVKFDLPKVFNEARAIIGKIDDATLKQFDAALAQVPAQFGLNIEQDLIAPLGDEWIMYRAPLSDLGGNSLALVHKLRDGDRFTKTLTAVEDLANKLGAGQFKIDKMKSGPIEYSTITITQYSVAWTVRNGYLYMSSMDGIVGAIKQVENKLPSIAESDLFRKALAVVNVPGVKPTAIAYANPGKLYPELRRTLLGLLPLARAVGIDLPTTLLPDTDAILPILTPGASIAWWDAEGMHQSGHTSFPGVEIMGGSPGGPVMVVAAASLGTAILLPSLGRARELANRSADAANLRAISMGCIISAADANDKMPDDLARLIANGSISPKSLVSKRAGTAPLVMTPELEKLAKDNFPAFAAQVAQHCDFIYLGKGTTASTDAGIIVAYEKPGPQVRDGMNMAFGDGHVEFVRFAGLAQTFGPTNDLLKKNGLPPVDVQAILNQSGVTAPLIGPAQPAQPAMP